MGKSKSSAPNITYSPPPPPPPPPTAVPSQSLQTQVGLNEVSGAQSRLNMTLGAQLDQQNKAFFTNEDIRQGQAMSGEERLTIGKTGEETRATIGTQGEQNRLGYQTQGEQERLTVGTQGEQQRLGYQTQGTEQRKTLTQEQMENRYIAQRGRDWSKEAYRA